MFCKKIYNIGKVILKIIFNRCKYYKIDTILDIISNTSYIVANILFWICVTEIGWGIKGWQLSDLLVFVAFSELFFSIEAALFGVASRFWYIIYSGTLDVLMVQPLDPRVRFMLFNINIKEIVNGCIKFIVILVVSGMKINIIRLIIGVLIVLWSNCILALIRLSLSYSAFWFGKMDAISEIADSLSQFNKYPLTVMPYIIKCVISIFLPFYFFSTFSAEYVSNKVSYMGLENIIIGIIVNSLLWLLINKFVWRLGRERYEGING